MRGQKRVFLRYRKVKKRYCTLLGPARHKKKKKRHKISSHTFGLDSFKIGIFIWKKSKTWTKYQNIFLVLRPDYAGTFCRTHFGISENSVKISGILNNFQQTLEKFPAQNSGISFRVTGIQYKQSVQQNYNM